MLQLPGRETASQSFPSAELCFRLFAVLVCSMVVSAEVRVVRDDISLLRLMSRFMGFIHSG